MTTYAFTGHRPKDLPVGWHFSHTAKELDKYFLMRPEEIRFITGGALGIDSWAAEYALRSGFHLTLALPFRPEIQSTNWPIIARDRLMDHVRRADEVHIINPNSYDVRSFQERNEYMVDHADEVLAFWSGKPYGGTTSCIRYALQVHKPVVNLLPGRYQGVVREIR